MTFHRRKHHLMQTPPTSYLYAHYDFFFMYSKIIATVAVVAIVASACVGYAMVRDDDYSQSYRFGDGESDFTLLDSDSKIVKGLTIRMTAKSDGYNYDRLITVTDVDGDTLSTHELLEDDVTIGLSYFLPGESGVWKLDYTGDSPDPNLTISKDGNVYTINGNATLDGSDVTFSGMKITYDGLKVTYVEGKTLAKTTFGPRSESDTTTYETKGDLVRMYGPCEATVTVSRGDLYEWNLANYDADDYSGATITDGQGRFGNVDCTIYTVNGTVSRYGETYVYKDYDIYVYDGFVLRINGTIDGTTEYYTVSMYIES